MKRKFLLLGLAAILISCASEPSNAEIQQAVRDYYSVSRPIVGSNTVSPPYYVLGISIDRRNDAFYVVDVDLEKPGGGVKKDKVFCRKYTSDGKSYWRAEDYDPRFDDKFKKR